MSESIKRKDIAGMSFGFSVKGADGETWRERKDYQIERELMDVDLYEVTVTPIPAYKNTNVVVRNNTNTK